MQMLCGHNMGPKRIASWAHALLILQITLNNVEPNNTCVLLTQLIITQGNQLCILTFWTDFISNTNNKTNNLKYTKTKF